MITLWVTAWDEKSFTQWSVLGEYREAADTLLEFNQRAPGIEQAPFYLYEAARILERDNHLADAAQIWERVMAEYASSDYGWRSLFLAGVTYYRLANYELALTTFQRALVFAADAEEQSAADFWIAKTYQAQGKPRPGCRLLGTVHRPRSDRLLQRARSRGPPGTAADGGIF